MCELERDFPSSRELRVLRTRGVFIGQDGATKVTTVSTEFGYEALIVDGGRGANKEV